MQRIWANLFQSKTPLMVMLRYVLVGIVVILGMVRLRTILVLLGVPETYTIRDSTTYYLMAKAITAGENPYLPLNELANKFIGTSQFYPHPALCTPFTGILSIPLAFFSVNKSSTIWFGFEMICLAIVAMMLTILWKGRLVWVTAILTFALSLAWFPIMVDLLYGQLSILITVFLIATLLALSKNRKILAGVLIGFSVAIKLITWPLILYFALRKNWRALISSIITTIGLNLAALLVIGIGPFMDYYLRITFQFSKIYYTAMNNFSLWSIGYRLFNESPVVAGYLNAPPLVNLPWLAPIFSGGLVIAFFIIGMSWVIKSNDLYKAYAILVCILVAISPISWIHYHILLIISLFILWGNLVKYSFPKWQTLFSVILTFFIFLSNEQVGSIIIFLNRQSNFVTENSDRISFLSSLLIWIPILSLVTLTILLWRSGENQKQAKLIHENILLNYN
jgi:hypothetical protein